MILWLSSVAPCVRRCFSLFVMPLGMATCALMGSPLSTVAASSLVSISTLNASVAHIATETLDATVPSAALTTPEVVPPSDTLRQISDVEVWAPEANKSSVTTLSPTQKMSQSEARRLGVTDVASILKLMSGVSVRDYGGLGGMKTVSVRNLGAAHTAVSYDGVPVSNCLAGQIDVSRFAAERLSEVRLHLGQSDDLLTPALLQGAMGVLQLTTTQPAAQRRLTGELSAASWNTFAESFSLEVPLRRNRCGMVRQGITLSGSHHSTVGNYPYTFRNGVEQERLRRQNSHVHAAQAEADWRSRWSEHLSSDTKLYYYRIHNELPGGIIYYNTYSREAAREENLLWQTRATAAWGDASGGNEPRWHAVGIVKYSYARTLHTDPLTAPEWQREVYYQNEGYAQASLSYRASRHWQLAVAEDCQLTALRSPRSDCPDPLRRSSYTALRARYESGGWLVQPSLLYTAVRDDKASDHDFWSPALSARWQPAQRFPLYARLLVRRAYRLPSFNDLYYVRVGNRNLRPERADELNAGLTYRYTSRRFSGDATVDYYEQYVHDKIVAVPATFTYKMLNFERARLHGLDVTVAASYAFARDCVARLNAGYMFQRAVDRTEVSRGSQLPYTPRNSGNGTLTVDNRLLTVGYTVQWMGERFSSRMNTAQYRLQPFSDQSLTLSHTFHLPGLEHITSGSSGHGSRGNFGHDSRGSSGHDSRSNFGHVSRGNWGNSSLQLYVTVQNLWDKSYEVVQYYPMPGRQCRVGVRWQQ